MDEGRQENVWPPCRVPLRGGILTLWGLSQMLIFWLQTPCQAWKSHQSQTQRSQRHFLGCQGPYTRSTVTIISTEACRIYASIAEPLFFLNLIKSCTRPNKCPTRHSDSFLPRRPDLVQGWLSDSVSKPVKSGLTALFFLCFTQLFILSQFYQLRHIPNTI